MYNKYHSQLKCITISFFFVLVAVFFTCEISSLDVWLHLGAGKYILENFRIPTYDIFSYTLLNRMWIDHEWLFQIIIYSLYNKFGPNGLIIMRMLVFVLTFALLFRLGYKRNNFIIIIVTLLPALILARHRFFVRPEIFTLLFTALYLFILHKYKSTRLIYVLIPVQLLWVNIHGYFLIGFVVVFSYIIGELLARFINLASKTKERQTLNKDASLRLMLAAFLLIAVCFINPYTYKVFLYSVKTLFQFAKHSEFLTNYIMELRKPLGPSFKYSHELWYRGLGFISAVLILLNIKRTNLGQYLIYIVFFLMSISANRNIALFSFIAAATVICNFNDMALKLSGTRIAQRLAKYKRVIADAICIFLVMFMLKYALRIASDTYYVEGTRFKNVNFGISETQYSKGVIKFIKEKNITGKIFNNFSMGAYLIGNAYPQCKVFIDGRTEVYGVDFLRQYKDIMYGRSPFEDIVNRYDIRYVILRNPAVPRPFLHKLYRRKDWRLVYFDGIAIVFAKDIQENKELIKNCEVKLIEPQMDLSSSQIEKLRDKKVFPFFYLARSCFYKDINLYEFAIKEIENALAINPDCGESYYALGIVYSIERRHRDAIKAYKEAIKKGYDNEHVRNNLGALYARMELFDWAIMEFKKALRFNSKSLFAKQNLNNCYELKKICKEERDKLQKKLPHIKNSLERADIYYKTGNKFYERKCFVSAIIQLSKVLKLNPGFSDKIKLYNVLGSSFAQLGIFEKALKEFENALKLNPEDAVTLCNLGSLYWDKRDFNKAKKFWQRTLRIDPGYKLAENNLKKL